MGELSQFRLSTQIAKGDEGIVEGAVQLGDLLVLRRVDRDQRPVLIDDKEPPVSQQRALFPLTFDTFGLWAAMDGVDDDAFRDGCLAGIQRVDRPLGKGLVAGDENCLVDVWRRVPREVQRRAFDDGAAVF